MEITQFTTISGSHKVGYTKEDCVTRRDSRLFDKIDTDSDGTLSPYEIVERRNKELKGKTVSDIIVMLAGIVLLACKDPKSKPFVNFIKICLGSGLCAGAMFKQYTLIGEGKKTQFYIERLQKLNREC